MVSRFHEFLKANFPAIFCWLLLLAFFFASFGLMLCLFDFGDFGFFSFLTAGLFVILFCISFVLFILDENRKDRELQERIANERIREQRENRSSH